MFLLETKVIYRQNIKKTQYSKLIFKQGYLAYKTHAFIQNTI